MNANTWRIAKFEHLNVVLLRSKSLFWITSISMHLHLWTLFDLPCIYTVRIIFKMYVDPHSYINRNKWYLVYACKTFFICTEEQCKALKVFWHYLVSWKHLRLFSISFYYMLISVLKATLTSINISVIKTWVVIKNIHM